MSICKGVGNGIGGALGKFGSGLGSALGLGAAVDLATKAYTGYGLLETLSVPYIECEDGSFATAIEWYGSGLKCPKKPETVKPQIGPGQKSSHEAGEDYAKEIEALGGLVFPYFGTYGFSSIPDILAGKSGEYIPGNFKKEDSEGYKYSGQLIDDKQGNAFKVGYTDTGDGFAGASMYYGHNVYTDGRPDSENYIFRNGSWGGWGGMLAPGGLTYADIRRRTREGTLGYSTKDTALLGVRISLPSLPFAPPAASIPPPPAFFPSPPSSPENCEMSCPCISPADIENAVKRALGLQAFAPEKLVREIGAKMFAAPGPSLVPVVPLNLVEAIAAIVATSYMRAGYGRYPVVMPSSLINDDGAGDAVPTNAIENFAEWFEWHIKQQDAIQGEWPIDIAVVDGAKRQPLKYENISEALSEMTGMLLQTATDADASVNAACTAAAAATKANNSAIIAQKNVECLIRFFGVRTGFKSIFVQSLITPADPDDRNFNLRKFLTPSGQNLAYLSDEDPFDFQAMLDRILRNTEISRASVARSIDKDGLPGDFARNQRRYDAAESRKEAQKELEKLEQSIQSKNPDFKVKIKVDTPVSDSIAGDNFVIKRLKSTNNE